MMFKKYNGVLIILGFMCLMGLASVSQAAGRFEMGTEISYFNYEEPGVMEQDGMLYGIYASYDMDLDQLRGIKDVPSDQGSVLMLDTFFKFGQVDYESPVSGTLDDIDDYMFEISSKWGYQFPFGEASVLTPYLGLGYRYLNDDSSGMQTSVGHYGYERESNYIFAPIGVKTSTDLDSEWTLGLNLEFDIFLHGKQKSHLEDVSPSLNTVENDQEKGYGVRGSVQLVREGERFDVSIEPFVRYWDIDESNIATINCGGTPCALGYEPKNESLDTGVRLGLQF